MTIWTKVSSSAIRKIGYDAATNRMYIDFEDSDPYYTFCNVPESVYRDFTCARSVGSYYHRNIKDRFQC
ncbi:KTSC domain-containing protein [uncultured Alteromonas sp.]|uniref:KTSC domain-containing protein n=1 Tax=uncultured Alteromonas sp. TaxID=179113 RepID=UPI0030D835E1